MKKQRTPNQIRSPVTRERIRVIAHLMARGGYIRPTVPVQLAEKWGVTEKTVENYASQAANFVRLTIGDDEQIKNEMMLSLRAIQSQCVIRATERYPEGHAQAGELRERNAYQWYNTALSAMRDLVNLTGIGAAQRVEVSGEYTLDDLGLLNQSVKANQCEQKTSEPISSPLPFGTSGLSVGWSKSSPSQADVKN